ncbi:MAG: hypothetical protein NTW87_24150 [Planctomycetota bacterium]|nr:hypothetical protein [Planctomycetota bacterium]
MFYKATYTDGSAELVEAPDIRKAKSVAQKLYDVAVKNVVVQDDVDDTDLDEDDEEDVEEDDEDVEKKKRR